MKGSGSAVLFGALASALLLMAFGTGPAFAEPTSDTSRKPLIPILNEDEQKEYQELREKAHVLRNEIRSYQEPISEETRKLIAEKETEIEEILKEVDELYPLPPVVEISPEREAELTRAMWMMAWTHYPFVTMGIESYSGAIGVTLDETKVDVSDREQIEHVLRSVAGDGIQLNIYYMENKIKFQGSCNGQDGECSPIIGAKGEPNHIEDVDCAISIVGTKNNGTADIPGVVIPHHCNKHHGDYYQPSKNDDSHEVGAHHTDGGGFMIAISLKLITDHIKLAESTIMELTSGLATVIYPNTM